jgi:hypothetical protein
MEVYLENNDLRARSAGQQEPGVKLTPAAAFWGGVPSAFDQWIRRDIFHWPGTGGVRFHRDATGKPTRIVSYAGFLGMETLYREDG